MFEKFDTTQGEDNLLFKIYIQILNIVYSKMPIIICQCDEHILQLRQRQNSLPEIDNDTLIYDYTKDLFDYLYRQIWVICESKLFYTPYLLARMAEYNSIAFDEEDFEFGAEGDNYFCLLRKDKGQKNTVVDNDEDEQDIDMNSEGFN